MRNVTTMLVVLSALTAVARCSASYEDRMAYLRKVAGQGAQTHQLLVDQAAPVINADRCTQAWNGLKNPSEYPSDTGVEHSPDWENQIRQFFVDSCVSGKPKPVPGDPTTSPAPSKPPASTAAASTAPAR
uniref:hypothetical protein n=1 Tax=Amycolatopsis sp. CA-151526 TaxID=3239921 RepID=UPI003F498C8C